MSKSIQLLCLTEPGSHPPFDTTVELYNRLAQNPQIELWHANPNLANRTADISCTQIRNELSFSEFEALDERSRVHRPWAEFDLVFCRTDKPYPNEYLEILHTHEDAVRFVNSPSGILKHLDFGFSFPLIRKYLPDHTLTSNTGDAESFLAVHSMIVAKQSRSYGGKGVYKVWSEGPRSYTDNITEGTVEYGDTAQLFGTLFSRSSDPYLLVRFLPNASAGDKRVLVVGGEIYGGYVRRSTKDHWVHNITSGGSAFPAEIGENEKRTVIETWPSYRSLGIHTLGYDFLQDDDEQWILSEVNAGNIGGYGRLEQLSRTAVYDQLIQWLIDFADS